MKRIDMHVHMVGSARSGHGCWLRITPGKLPLYYYMLRHIGLPISSLNSPRFDKLFAENLLKHIRTSSLDAVVLLAQEEVYDDDGHLIENCGNAHVPNDYVLELAREHHVFLPAVSIHPARPDALDELDRCLAAGAVMMKCLPNCQNINCNNPRFKKFWNRMAEAGLPLLAHTGGENTLQVIEPKYADPETMTLPLECGVTVIAAHCATRSGLFDPDYLTNLTTMFAQHENLFADTSALNLPFRSYGLRRCLENEHVAPRLVHGSDYPVPSSGLWAWLRGLITTDELSKSSQTKNPLERDHQLKRAMGFPPEHFTRINDLLRPVD
jgi:predicted TIM-barrel fold metal-dependent hydrolase